MYLAHRKTATRILNTHLTVYHPVYIPSCSESVVLFVGAPILSRLNQVTLVYCIYLYHVDEHQNKPNFLLTGSIKSNLL